MSIVTAILAGGAGLRIGGAKPERQLAGTRLVTHALNAAHGWGAPTVLVLRDPKQVSEVHDPVILDDPGIPGPLGGLASALAWAAVNGADRVLTIPCDMPFLPADLRVRLDQALTRDAGVAVTASDGRLHPVCALWCTSALPVLVHRANRGQLSLNGLSEAVGRVVVDWPIDERDPFLNINTLDDLALAEGLAV
ncbi:molybdenum cofactor guanylyltransferase [uncultured Brevundimonas sp.]|uniref:molybdenum cofactor guanylyltransferase n=1 Tax=uncultured Brevundimonas sp. TaxID=213418 RepID=UPI0030EED5A0|tara:strand:- start:19427 stop:20008 length:582 start_codon:yes stop_codon:yes gene_type:complete